MNSEQDEECSLIVKNSDKKLTIHIMKKQHKQIAEAQTRRLLRNLQESLRRVRTAHKSDRCMKALSHLTRSSVI